MLIRESVICWRRFLQLLDTPRSADLYPVRGAVLAQKYRGFVADDTAFIFYFPILLPDPNMDDIESPKVSSNTKAPNPGPWLHAWYDPLAGTLLLVAQQIKFAWKGVVDSATVKFWVAVSNDQTLTFSFGSKVPIHQPHFIQYSINRIEDSNWMRKVSRFEWRRWF